MKQSKRSRKGRKVGVRTLNAEDLCNWVTITTTFFGDLVIENQIETIHGISQRYVSNAITPFTHRVTLYSILNLNSLREDAKRRFKGYILESPIFTQTLSKLERYVSPPILNVSVSLKKPIKV